MTGLSTYSAGNLLSIITKGSAYPVPGSLYIALFTAVGTDAGAGFTEVSGGGYARASCLGSGFWGSPSGAIPDTVTNSAGAISFPQATASWGTVIAWGLYDASTGGNLLYWDFLGNDPWFPFTATANATAGVFTAIGITSGSSPTLVNGSSVVFTSEYGGALNGVVQYTVYTVANLSTDTFTVGVATTVTSAANVRQITQQSVPTNVTPSFSTSSLTLTAA